MTASNGMQITSIETPQLGAQDPQRASTAMSPPSAPCAAPPAGLDAAELRAATARLGLPGDALRAQFARWAAFGRGSSGADSLGHAQFAKLCRDAGLSGDGALSGADVDLTFVRARARGAQRLAYPEFLAALALAAEKLGHGAAEAVARVAAAAPGGAVASPRRLSGGAAPAPAPARPGVGELECAEGVDSNDEDAGPTAPPAPPATPPGAPPATPPGAPPATPPGAPPCPGSAERAALLRVFAAYAGYGAGGIVTGMKVPPVRRELDGKQFAKLAREAGLLRAGGITPVAVDLAFAKARPRGARRLRFPDFESALALLAAEPGAPPAAALRAAAAACGAPRAGTAAADDVRLASPAAFSGLAARAAAARAEPPRAACR